MKDTRVYTNLIPYDKFTEIDIDVTRSNSTHKSHTHSLLFEHSVSMNLFLLTADPLGRVSPDDLPDEVLLQLCTQKLSEDSQRCFRKVDGDYRPLSAWPPVRFDKDLNALGMYWSHVGLSGTFQMDFLPRHVEAVRLSNNALQGTLRTSMLPLTIRTLNLSSNLFEGTVDLQSLPPQIGMLNLSLNSFEGTIELCDLPESLHILLLSDNKFHGKVDMTMLARPLDKLTLDGNAIEMKE